MWLLHAPATFPGGMECFVARGSTPLRVVIVGAGSISREHARAIDLIPEAKLVAVADTNRDAASALASHSGALAVSSLAECLSELAVDAAIVATPTHTHIDIGTEALSAGLHVMIEKPVAPSLTALDSIVSQASASKLVLVSGQVVRFLPTVAVARELVASGRIGHIQQLVERRFELRREAAAWWSKSEDFLLHHWGSHSIDLMIDLFKVKVTRILCRGDSSIPGFGGLASVDLLGQLDGGGRVAVHHSLSGRHRVHDLLVVGTEGSLLFTGYGSVSLDGEELFSARESDSLAEGFRAQMADFVLAARGEKLPRASASTMSAPLAVLQAASRSLESGEVEPVKYS